jgi:phage tail sheath gpL-like
MSAPIPLNPNLPSNWRVPGIYISLDLRGSSAGIGTLAKRILLVGHKTATGIAPLNTVVQILGQSNANLLFGQGSDLARQHKATLAQIGSGMADIFAIVVPEPVGGVQSTHLITFIGNAQGAGAVEIAICGLTTTVAIANLDTAATIAANAAAAINAELPDAPVTAQANGPTVTLTYRHAGLVGNDLPVMVTFSGNTGVQASPGSISFNGLGVGAGSVVVDIGATAVQAAINSNDTGINIAQSLAQAFAADAYPCTAAATGAGVLTLYYAPDRGVHRISAAIFTTTAVSVALAVGTLGAGQPTLTQSLGNVASQSAFGCWASGFVDAQSLSAMAAHIEAYADGLRQKDQELFIASTDALATAAAIAPNTTPALSSSPRYAIGWCADSPEQAYELAARMAACVCVEDYYPYNYDGQPLETDDTTPLLLPHVNSRPDDGECNAALNLGLTPLVADEVLGQLVILSDRTTMQTQDDRLWGWGTIRTLAFYRADLRAFLKQRFPNKSLKLTGVPRTAYTVNLESIRDAVLERIRQWDNADLFDGVDAIKDEVTVSPNATNRTRIDIFVPCKPPQKLSQLGADAALT